MRVPRAGECLSSHPNRDLDSLQHIKYFIINIPGKLNGAKACPPPQGQGGGGLLAEMTTTMTKKRLPPTLWVELEGTQKEKQDSGR